MTIMTKPTPKQLDSLMTGIEQEGTIGGTAYRFSQLTFKGRVQELRCDLTGDVRRASLSAAKRQILNWCEDWLPHNEFLVFTVHGERSFTFGACRKNRKEKKQ